MPTTMERPDTLVVVLANIKFVNLEVANPCGLAASTMLGCTIISVIAVMTVMMTITMRGISIVLVW